MRHSLILRSTRILPFLSPDDDGGNNDATDAANSGEKITFKDQADLDRFIQRRLDRDREAQKTKLRDEVKEDLVNEQAAEENKEQGKFKDLYDKEVKKVEKLETTIQDMKDAEDTRVLSELRKTIAAKHKLPDELAERLVGTTEDELTADAKLLAKKLNVKEDEEGEEEERNLGRRPPVRKSDTDVGKGTRPTKPSGDRPDVSNQQNNNSGKKGSPFAFVKEGDVSWG